MATERELTALYFFNTGESACAYETMGAHPLPDGGWRFLVWAPNARAVHVAGSFNGFDPAAAPMQPIGETGVWEAVVASAKRGDTYKYAITAKDGTLYWRTDPYATRAEERPGTASVLWGIPTHPWGDAAYYEEKKGSDPYREPMNIYEVHLGSFRQGLSYRQLADELVEYAADMGYTHIELLPVTEYPLDMSWGYQVTGYYAATNRYGTPEDLMYFVDQAHQRGLGVLLDWVSAHFPRDAHGLRLYDGTPLYEPDDPRRSEQPQWGTMLFDYGRTQVQSFLLSNAFYFLKEFHFDGLRVDAVSCMLYHDYGRAGTGWVPNVYGGRENLEAIAFLRKLTAKLRTEWPNGERLLIAEESTSFPYVTKPAEEGGLGFHFKWNMGWMNDTLSYMEKDPIHRKWHHDKLTFSLCYAFSEHYVLPFSHDEVVHGKHSMLDKMPGDYWRKFAQLRLTLAYQFAHPGKKLNFMGNEFGQFIEWRYGESLDWLLLDYPMHRGMQAYSRMLNQFYKNTPALYECDGGWDGFEWAGVDDGVHSVVAFFRRDAEGNTLLCAFNFTPVPWENYVLPATLHAQLHEVFSSDAQMHGGTGDWHNPIPLVCAGKPKLRLPPLGAVFFRVEEIAQEGQRTAT